MRYAVRNKERWKGRRAPTQDPGTKLVLCAEDTREDMLITGCVEAIDESDEDKFATAVAECVTTRSF